MKSSPRSLARVHVSIDRLVLHGFAPHQREALAQGLQTGLARLFADPMLAGSLGESRNLALLDTNRSLPIATAKTPRLIGAESAARIVAGLRS